MACFGLRHVDFMLVSKFDLMVGHVTSFRDEGSKVYGQGVCLWFWDVSGLSLVFGVWVLGLAQS